MALSQPFPLWDFQDARSSRLTISFVFRLAFCMTGSALLGFSTNFPLFSFLLFNVVRKSGPSGLKGGHDVPEIQINIEACSLYSTFNWWSKM